MLLILLSLFESRDNLIWKLHRKKLATLMKDGFLMADSKLEGITNKEALALFIYKSAWWIEKFFT